MAKKLTHDGRVLLSGKDYTANKIEFWSHQGERCAGCGRRMDWREMHFHHFRGRGIGGSKRDDSDPRNQVLCPPCHAKEEEKKRAVAG